MSSLRRDPPDLLIKYVVLVGSLDDGFTAYGTFDSLGKADEFQHTHGPWDFDHWIMDLHPPEEQKKTRPCIGLVVNKPESTK